MSKRLSLRPSKLHGIGLFVNEFMEKGKPVGSMRLAYMGPVSNFTSLPATGCVIDNNVYAVVEGFPLWYVNYSDDPNINIEGPVIYAIKSIAKDDELTLRDPEAATTMPASDESVEIVYETSTP